MKRWMFIAGFLAVLGLPSCTIVNGTSIITGSSRVPTSAEEIRIYREEPKEYQEIAIVAASAGHDFRSSEGLLESAFKRLKQEAAKVGANGILLIEIHERDTPAVTTTYGAATVSGRSGSATATGTGIAVNRGDPYTKLRGIAIYVP